MSKIRVYKRGENIRLTKNFHLSEMECKCGRCPTTTVDLDHMARLQSKREQWGRSVKVTSGYRCDEQNKRVGGASKSKHKDGTATDIQVKRMYNQHVQDECEDFDGLGRYNSFTHVDSRGWKARWDFRTKK